MQRKFKVQEAYDYVLKRLEYHARWTYRTAKEEETRLLIQNPNWIPPEGQSPVQKWEAEWVKSGAVTEQFKTTMPSIISDTKGMSTTTPVERTTILTELIVSKSGHIQVILSTRFLYGDEPTPDESLPRDDTLQVGRQAGDWEAYTDGAGNLGTKTSAERAGWAFVILKDGKGRDAEGATIEHYGYGPVILNKSHPAYTGAIRCTNNTGELGAVVELLHCLLTYGSQPTDTTGIIRTDSTYAASVAMGRVIHHENLVLAAEAARLWNKLRVRQKGKIYWRHVKGHSDQKWNDHVDHLADMGMQGLIHTKDPRWKTELDDEEGEGEEGESSEGKCERGRDEDDYCAERVDDMEGDSEDRENLMDEGEWQRVLHCLVSEAMGKDEEDNVNHICEHSDDRAHTLGVQPSVEPTVPFNCARTDASIQCFINCKSIISHHIFTPKFLIQTKINAYFKPLNPHCVDPYFSSPTFQPPLSPTPIELSPRIPTPLPPSPHETSVHSPSLNDPLPFLRPTPLYGMCVPVLLRVAPNNVLRASDWWLCSPPRQPTTYNSHILSPHFSPPTSILPPSGGKRPYAAEQPCTQELLPQLSLIPGPPSPRHSVKDSGFWSALGRGVRNLLPGPWLAPSRLICRVSHTLSRIFGTGNSKREAEDEGGAQCSPKTGAHLGGRGLAPSLEGATCAPE